MFPYLKRTYVHAVTLSRGTLLGVDFWHDSLNFTKFPSKHVELWEFILGVVVVTTDQNDTYI